MFIKANYLMKASYYNREVIELNNRVLKELSRSYIPSAITQNKRTIRTIRVYSLKASENIGVKNFKKMGNNER